MQKDYISPYGVPVTDWETKYGSGSGVRCEVEQNRDRSWTSLWRINENQDLEAAHRFSERDENTLLSFSCSVVQDPAKMPLTGIHFDLTHKSMNVSIWGGWVKVSVFPDHPDYNSFDFPEEELEPSPEDEPNVMGKILFCQPFPGALTTKF